MKLKLLERTDAPIEDKEHGIRFRLGGLLPEHAAEMKGLMYSSKSPSAAMAIYAMRECMTELEVGGEEIEPRKASVSLDYSDANTQALLDYIAALLVEHVILDDEARKKLQQQRLTSSQAKMQKAAKRAHSKDKG